MDRKRRRHESAPSTSLIEIMERYDRAEAGPWPVEDTPEPILESSEPILTCVETPAPSGSVGASLKATRLRKGISLDEVYAATKIHPRVLVRLEADKYDSLPALQVARFVRNYAGFLGIDPQQLAAEHPELGKKSSEPPITNSPEQLPFVWPHVPVSRKLWTPASLGIAACVLVAPLIGFSGPGTHKAVASEPRPVAGPSVTVPTATPSPAFLPDRVLAGDAAPASAANLPATSGDPITPAPATRAAGTVPFNVTCNGKTVYKGFLSRDTAEGALDLGTTDAATADTASVVARPKREALGLLGNAPVKRVTISITGPCRRS